MVRERKDIYNNDYSLSHFMETLKSLSNVKSSDHLVLEIFSFFFFLWQEEIPTILIYHQATTIQKEKKRDRCIRF